MKFIKILSISFIITQSFSGILNDDCYLIKSKSLKHYIITSNYWMRTDSTFTLRTESIIEPKQLKKKIENIILTGDLLILKFDCDDIDSIKETVKEIE